MPAVRCDIEKISGLQMTARCFIGKTQACFALQEQHPFAFRLVVPEVRRAALAGRNDAFKA